MIRFPVYKPNLTGNEKHYVLECLDSSWISSKGEFINKFETAFAEYTGARHAVTVSNGTVALHLALLALGIRQGDEVIVPTLTYIASVNAIAYCGATPVFADSVAKTWQLDPSDVERKITPRTKAIMAVHLYGQPCDMHALREIATKHRLFLIEDCAEALGSRLKDTHVGTLGDIATYSFYGNKTITTGEGGMVTTNDATLADRARHFRGQGLASHREYWHDVIGYNYRMTNICAALGLAQLERIDSILRRKREIAMLYRKDLQRTPFEMQTEAENSNHSFWMVSILLPEDVDRAKLRQHLTSEGIETRPLFYPVHTMPMYSSSYQRHEVAEDLARRGLNLPSYPDLSNEDVLFICDSLKSFLRP